MSGAPEFVLLDATGPRPEAFLLSFSFLSALLTIGSVLAPPIGSAPPSRAEFVSEIVLAPGPLWLPRSPATLSSRRPAVLPSEPGPPAQELSSPAPSSGAGGAVRTEPPLAQLPKLRVSLVPLPLSSALTATRNLPPPPVASQSAAGSARTPVPAALGALPLPQLISREATPSADLAALPPARRLALPRLSIRVDADWLEALPQTREELYFSVTNPKEKTEVLTYLPATRSFTLKRPLRPLWQVREGDRVPALAALRSAAARELGVSPELVGLYTWHPPVLENALRMFVLARIERLGVQLGPSDVVTVRFASGPDGCLMTLEPFQTNASQ